MYMCLVRLLWLVAEIQEPYSHTQKPVVVFKTATVCVCVLEGIWASGDSMAVCCGPDR